MERREFVTGVVGAASAALTGCSGEQAGGGDPATTTAMERDPTETNTVTKTPPEVVDSDGSIDWEAVTERTEAKLRSSSFENEIRWGSDTTPEYFHQTLVDLEAKTMYIRFHHSQQKVEYYVSGSSGSHWIIDGEYSESDKGFEESHEGFVAEITKDTISHLESFDVSASMEGSTVALDLSGSGRSWAKPYDFKNATGTGTIAQDGRLATYRIEGGATAEDVENPWEELRSELGAVSISQPDWVAEHT